MKQKTVFQTGDTIKDKEGKVIGRIIKMESCKNSNINRIDFGENLCEKNNLNKKLQNQRHQKNPQKVKCVK